MPYGPTTASLCKRSRPGECVPCTVACKEDSLSGRTAVGSRLYLQYSAKAIAVRVSILSPLQATAHGTHAR